MNKQIKPQVDVATMRLGAFGHLEGQPRTEREFSTDALVDRIKTLQSIQKTHSPDMDAWQTASELLAPCFDEMARRSDAGELAGMTIRL